MPTFTFQFLTSRHSDSLPARERARKRKLTKNISLLPWGSDGNNLQLFGCLSGKTLTWTYVKLSRRNPGACLARGKLRERVHFQNGNVINQNESSSQHAVAPRGAHEPPLTAAAHICRPKHLLSFRSLHTTVNSRNSTARGGLHALFRGCSIPFLRPAYPHGCIVSGCPS